MTIRGNMDKTKKDLVGKSIFFVHTNVVFKAEVTGYDNFQLFCNGYSSKSGDKISLGISNECDFFLNEDDLFRHLRETMIVLREKA